MLFLFHTVICCHNVNKTTGAEIAYKGQNFLELRAAAVEKFIDPFLTRQEVTFLSPFFSKKKWHIYAIKSFDR